MSDYLRKMLEQQEALRRATGPLAGVPNQIDSLNLAGIRSHIESSDLAGVRKQIDALKCLVRLIQTKKL
jgi:hypothetical protein